MKALIWKTIRVAVECFGWGLIIAFLFFIGGCTTTQVHPTILIERTMNHYYLIQPPQAEEEDECDFAAWTCDEKESNAI